MVKEKSKILSSDMVFVESRKAADKELKNEGEDKLMET
jgi:hypothetical protein